MKKIWRVIDGIEIYGNGHDVPLIYGWDLTEKEKEEFDYLDNIEEDFTGFRYKGWTYDLNDFMRTEKNSPFFGIFDGIHSDTFFSGVGIKISNGGESIKAYTFIS